MKESAYIVFFLLTRVDSKKGFALPHHGDGVISVIKLALFP